MSPAVIAFALVTLLMPNGSHQVSRVPLPTASACSLLGEHAADLGKLLGGKVTAIECVQAPVRDPQRVA